MLVLHARFKPRLGPLSNYRLTDFSSTGHLQSDVIRDVSDTFRLLLTKHQLVEEKICFYRTFQ